MKKKHIHEFKYVVATVNKTYPRCRCGASRNSKKKYYKPLSKGPGCFGNYKQLQFK